VLTGDLQARARVAVFVITRIEIVGAPADAEAAGVWHLTKGPAGFFSDDLTDAGFVDCHDVSLSGFKYNRPLFFCMRQENDFKFAPSEAPEIASKGCPLFVTPTMCRAPDDVRDRAEHGHLVEVVVAQARDS